MIVGTSVGSFVGSLYAYGYDAYALQKIGMTLERSDIAELTIPDNGFLKGERLRDYVNAKVRSAPWRNSRSRFMAWPPISRPAKVWCSIPATPAWPSRQVALSRCFSSRPDSLGRAMWIGGVVKPLAVDVARQYGAGCRDCR